MPDLCKHCGKAESEHHAFKAKVPRARWPKGCVCKRSEWAIVAGPICDKFQRSPDVPFCSRCEHDKACHAPKD